MSVVRIAPGQLSASLTLRNDSALHNCTEFDSDADGPFIARLWPGLSAGEEILWAVLSWLNGEGFLPSESDRRAGLDTVNQKAAEAAIEVGSRWTA